jgi:tripeptidyl-peptidase I
MKRTYSVIVFTVLLAVTACVVMEKRQLVGGSADWIREGRELPDAVLKIDFAVKQGGLEQLSRIFNDVSDPASDKYGQYLSFDEVNNLVSPLQANIDTLTRWVSSFGVEDCSFSHAMDFMHCHIPANIVEKMFKIQLHRYRHEKFQSVVVRANSHYELPSALAETVDFVGGLLQFPDMKMREMKEQTVNKQSIPNDILGVTPSILRRQYGVGSVVGKMESSIQAVAGFSGEYFHNEDLKEFNLLFASSYPHLDEVSNVIGHEGFISGMEASLDIQYIMSLGANISTWFWSVHAERSQDPFLVWMMQVANTSVVPWVHSVSYGMPEHTLSLEYVNRLNVEFQKAAVRGLSIMFASGDSGVGCGKGEKVFAPDFPASSPYITSVGGTRFPLLSSSSSSPQKEIGNTISGGGFSTLMPMPSYQENAVKEFLQNAKNLPPSTFYNASNRAYPDVSAGSSGFWIVDNLLPIAGIAGTSCAAPTFSGVISLLNDARLQKGLKPMGFLNPWLYMHSSALTDIIDGCNKGCLSQKGFCAREGWDPMTGNGVPNYDAMLKAALAMP